MKTPRTDAEILTDNEYLMENIGLVDFVRANFARKLETELTHAIAAANIQAGVFEQTVAENQELRQQIDNLTQKLQIAFPEISDPAALEELVEHSTIERLLYILHNYIDESGDADKKDATLLRTAIEKKALRLENELKELKATKRNQMDIAATFKQWPSS